MNTDSLRERAERLLALRSAATPGPWRHDAGNVAVFYGGLGQRLWRFLCWADEPTTMLARDQGEANAAFIAAAHEACDLLALLRDECAALRAELDEADKTATDRATSMMRKWLCNDSQRPCSWHEVQDCAEEIEAVSKAARATGAAT